MIAPMARGAAAGGEAGAAMIAPMARGAAIGATVVAGWALPGLAPLVPPLAAALRIPTTIDVPGAVALTFDDGPHPEGTPAVLEALAAAGARATFFMVGEQVRRSPALAAEVVHAGHAVAIHADRHRNLLRLSPAAVAADLDAACATIADATGVVPALHRAPYGIYSWPALRAVRARGWTPLLWSRWGRDWTRRATPRGIAAKVADGLRSGDVLLLHDADDYSAPGSHRRTAAALPRVLEAVAAAGLELVALDQPPGR
jgi:peptidoglycan/xylan/chitin deacetylase (PgdA/CDA1 family)